MYQELMHEIRIYTWIYTHTKYHLYLKTKALTIILSDYFMLGYITEDEAIKLAERGC